MEKARGKHCLKKRQTKHKRSTETTKSHEKISKRKNETYNRVLLICMGSIQERRHKSQKKVQRLAARRITARMKILRMETDQKGEVKCRKDHQ
jgi:hypothetical protein